MAKTKDDVVEPVVGEQPTRTDNPFTPGAAYESAPPPTAATVIKLWSGGERANAMALFKTLSVTSAEYAHIVASCPGWNELLSQ